MNSDSPKKKPGSIHMRIDPGPQRDRNAPRGMSQIDSSVPESDTSGSQLKTQNSYDIGSTIGEGGFGVVTEAKDANLERKVALKRLYPDRTNSRKNIQALVEEARITSQLQHPNIVPIYDLNPVGSHAFYTMKRVHGMTLEEILLKIRNGDEAICREYTLNRVNGTT